MKIAIDFNDSTYNDCVNILELALKNNNDYHTIYNVIARLLEFKFKAPQQSAYTAFLANRFIACKSETFSREKLDSIVNNLVSFTNEIKEMTGNYIAFLEPNDIRNRT